MARVFGYQSNWERGRIRPMKMPYKAELEKILTARLQGEAPGPLTRVHISDDGKFAVQHKDGKKTTRKLSRHAKEFLRTHEVFLVTQESFYEPEK